MWVTFTPLLGMSETVRRFLLEPSPDRSVTTMTIDERPVRHSRVRTSEFTVFGAGRPAVRFSTVFHLRRRTRGASPKGPPATAADPGA